MISLPKIRRHVTPVDYGMTVHYGRYTAIIQDWMEQPAWSGLDWQIQIYVPRLNRVLWVPMHETSPA